jgi:hypothetical protein
MYPSPNITSAVKLRRIRSPGHVARIGEMTVTKPEIRRLLGRTSRGRDNNLKYILKEYFVKVWTGFTFLSTVTGGGLL